MNVTPRNICQILNKIYIILIIVGLTGCGMHDVVINAPSTGIVPVSGNVYEIMDVDYRGIFGSESSLIERNLSKVNDFASKQGKVAVPILARKHKFAVASEFSWFYYKFTLVEQGSPESNLKISDIVIERDPRSSADFYNNRNKVDQQGVYEKIMHLDELRKEGLLTDTEFEQQKNKLMKDY